MRRHRSPGGVGASSAKSSFSGVHAKITKNRKTSGERTRETLASCARRCKPFSSQKLRGLIANRRSQR